MMRCDSISCLASAKLFHDTIQILFFASSGVVRVVETRHTKNEGRFRPTCISQATIHEYLKYSGRLMASQFSPYVFIRIKSKSSLQKSRIARQEAYHKDFLVFENHQELRSHRQPHGSFSDDLGRESFDIYSGAVFSDQKERTEKGYVHLAGYQFGPMFSALLFRLHAHFHSCSSHQQFYDKKCALFVR
jgi:hypothetical protein